MSQRLISGPNENSDPGDLGIHSWDLLHISEFIMVWKSMLQSTNKTKHY